ncbi:MAG: AAA family ATPase, partial [Clostridia bacterium]|nr:AAA family ATPase [Clostridia bacterium]
MIIKNIELTCFRSIEGRKIEFTPTVNVIHGRNAQGKTNI